MIELRLQCHTLTDEIVTALNNNLLQETEFNFEENETEKYLNISFIYADQADIRLSYSECQSVQTESTFAELTAKLKHLVTLYQTERETKRVVLSKLQGQLDWLKKELLKELDRTERKREYFANTEKAALYDAQLQCYQKINGWLDNFNDDSVI